MKKYNVTDEQLSAFIDGELDDEQHNAIQKQLENDQDLMARVKAIQSMNELLVSTYSSINDKPVPRAIFDILENDHASQTKPSSFLDKVKHFFVGKHEIGLAFATIAVVVISVPITKSLFSTSEYDSILLSGAINTNSKLHQVLDSAPSTQLTAVGKNNALTVTPIYTYKSVDGSYCREFVQQSSTQQARAIACKENEHWIIQIATHEPTSQKSSGEYVTATHSNSIEFDLFIDQNMSGIALNPKQELDIIEKKWP